MSYEFKLPDLGEVGFRDVTAYDPFSSPQRPEARFDIMTCFEVMEHSPDPRATGSDRPASR